MQIFKNRGIFGQKMPIVSSYSLPRVYIETLELIRWPIPHWRHASIAAPTASEVPSLLTVSLDRLFL
jgi:hypothetical protein